MTASPLLPDSYLQRIYAGQRLDAGTLVSSYFHRLKQLVQTTQYDLIWLEKEALPGVPAWFEKWLLRVPVVLDVDDAWHLRYSMSRNPWLRLFLGHKLEHIARSASAVTVANSSMYRWAENADVSSIHVIPTVVDLRRYGVAPPPQGPFTVGWIGTPSARGYLEQISPTLQKALSGPDSRLLVIGLDNFSLPGVQVAVYPWSEEQETVLLQQIHVGIMPLGAGKWEEGKSAYKAIQYMAASRPVIASPVGAALTVVSEGLTGFFATGDESWIAAIESLRNDPSLVAARGAAGRNQIEKKYSLQAQLPTMVSVLESAARRRRDP